MTSTNVEENIISKIKTAVERLPFFFSKNFGKLTANAINGIMKSLIEGGDSVWRQMQTS